MCDVDPDAAKKDGKDNSEADELVRKVHIETSENNPGKLKPYLLSSLSCVPGLKKSKPNSKNKTTKLEHFDNAFGKYSL